MQIGQLAQAAAVAIDHDMAGLKQAAQARLGALEDRIPELDRVRSALKQLVKACPGHGDLATCPILDALSEESP